MSTDLPEASAQADSPLQQYGYVRVYRAVAHQCGIPAAYLYGILEDYVQLGARTGRGCVPSHNHLAKLMNCHRRSVVTYMQALRDKGWIEWDEDNAGTPNAYRLPSRKKFTPPVQDLHIPYAKFAHNQERTSKTEDQEEPPVVPQGTKAKQATQLPEGWMPDEELLAWAEVNGVTRESALLETEQFIDHWHGKGERRKDWRATWRTWIRNSKRWGISKPLVHKNGHKQGGMSPREILAAADRLERQHHGS